MTPNTGSPSFDNKKVYVDVSFADIVPWFLDNRKEDIKRVKEFVEVSDFEQIQRMGHRWKGTCASYGFDKLSEAGELLENLSAQKNKEEILGLLERTNEYLTHLEVIYISPNEESDSNEVSF
jgi:HPt (histidine-containing phosphotransfer) domain-containing protein